jgi:hypothetical protein
MGQTLTGGQLAEAQAARPGPLAERIRQAKQRLGGKFAWTEQTRWELQEFLKGLTSNDKQSRLSGSSLDAAFADYQWTQPSQRQQEVLAHVGLASAEFGELKHHPRPGV